MCAILTIPMQMNDRAAAIRYVFLPARENVRETVRTIHDRSYMIFDPGKKNQPSQKLGLARSSANLFAIEHGLKKRRKKKRQTKEEAEERKR